MTTRTSGIAATRERTATGNPLIRSLRASFDRWQHRSRTRFELQQMSMRELADLGLSQADIKSVVNGTYRRDA